MLRYAVLIRVRSITVSRSLCIVVDTSTLPSILCVRYKSEVKISVPFRYFSKMSNDNKIIGYTKINKESYDFTWVISDYLLVLEVEEGKIESPIFDIGNNHRAQFQFKLNKRKDATTNKIHLYLLCVKTNAKMKSSYKISVMRDEECVHRAMDGHTFHGSSLKKIFDIDTRVMNEFCSSAGTVTIHCQLTIATGNAQNSLNNETAEEDEVPELEFDEDAFFHEHIAIVGLVTASEKIITASKGLLVKFSPVFKKMFDDDNLSQYYDMRDVNYEAAVEIVRYIVYRRIETREFSLIDEILMADEKYQIKWLKEHCEDILISNLSPKNGIENMEIADKYNMTRLREKAKWMLIM